MKKAAGPSVRGPHKGASRLARSELAVSRAAIEKAHELIAKDEYAAAQTILLEAVQKWPEDIALNAEAGLILCYSQKEFDAVDFLPKCNGSMRQTELLRILSDYFFCRNQLAQKLGVDDAKAKEKAAIVERYDKSSGARHQGTENIGVKLSACLIVKNEEKRLERCLRSVQPIVDEIVVVDTGSTDRTVEIAEKFGAKIGHFEWCEDFSAARNESLRLATGNWALWIDADEELDPESFSQMREAIMRPQFAGYYFRIVNLMDEEVEASTYVHSAVRLFRIMPDIRFSGRIHEQIIASFKEQGYVPATLTKGLIRHYGYQAAVMAEKNKIERTISMLQKEVEEAPGEPFHWFNLANAYSVASLAHQAESAARKCIELLEGEAPYGPAGFQILTSALTSLKRPEEAFMFCNKAVEMGYDTVLNEFERAHCLFEIKRCEEALASIERCMQMDWSIALTGDYGIKVYKSNILKSQILCALDRLEEAEENVEFALGVHAEFPMALFAKAQIREKQGQYDEAFDLYLRCSDAHGMWPSKKIAARMAKEQGRYLDAMLVYQQTFLEHPDDFECWLGWAQSSLLMEDSESFIEACETVGEERVPSADFLVNWGRGLVARGNHNEALRKFGAAITRDPENSNAYFNSGDTLYQLGHYREAAEIYQLGLKREPLNAEGWFVLGNCFAQLDIVKGALTSYSQALVLAPEHEAAKHNLELMNRAA